MRAATLVTLGVLALLLLATPVVADGEDTTEPTLADGERANASTMTVTVVDDTDVDESTINASDFSLSAGYVAAVRANESGSDATVSLRLRDRLNTNEVTVTIADDGDIADEAGNHLTEGSVTITGMDSYLPQLRDYRVERINDTAARIFVRANEPLSGLRLEVRGPSDANLTRGEFRAVDDSQYGVPHVTTFQFPVDGVYEVKVASLTDESGHLVNYTDREPFVRDPASPVPVLDGPHHLETGDTARFNASASTDNVGIARYEWTVGGDDAGDGTVHEHAFVEPGTHDVELTVTDHRGNEATTNRTVVVHEAPSKQGVRLAEANDGNLDVVVGTNRTNERVRIADDYGRLAGDDDVTVRSLTVTLPTDETLRLTVSRNATAPSFSETTGHEVLTAVSIGHGNETVDDPVFRFSVSASRLSRAGISYSDVALYRHDGNWTELPTEVVRATKSTVVYEAATPGLSTFVVGASGADRGWERPSDGTGKSDGTAGGGTTEVDGTEGEGSAIRVTGASLVTESVAFGEYAVVEATLVNDGNESGSFNAGLTVGPEVVVTRPVTVRAGETREIRFATPAIRNGTVAVNGTLAGDLTVTGGSGTTNGQATEERTGNGTGGGGFDVDVPIPDPLALWPDGLVGAILTGIVGVVVGTYSVLKALAIYLGY